MRDRKQNTLVVQQRSTTAIIVPCQMSSSPAEPFPLSAQYEQYTYECHIDKGRRSPFNPP